LKNLEYLLFNLLVIIGPVAFSFDKKVRYVRYWPAAIFSASVWIIPFIVWDSLVTDRHWWFNPVYTEGTFIGRLPAGEWLFFLTIPFASLFIWEILRFYRPEDHHLRRTGPFSWLWLGLLAAGVLFRMGKEYTGLVLLVFFLMAQGDLHLGGRVLARPNIRPYFAILGCLMLIFNGYLTARPIVLYNSAYQLGWRIFTIPVEDFLYGYSLILGCTSVYEKLRSLSD
jgi:lycopene cyclase domain-containing protein